MRTIQEVGTEILSGNPKPFYIFCGTEYGIKREYLDKIKSHYNGAKEEFEYVQDVIDMMRVKRFIPLVPSLYVVRYDEDFISSLNDKTRQQIESTNIVGTLVCIYEQNRHTTKLDKYLGKYSVSIDPVASQFIEKYLHRDFPSVPDRLVNIATKCGSDYNQSKNICLGLNLCKDYVVDVDDNVLYKLFGHESSTTSDMMKKGIAARDFNYCINILENNYPDLDSIYYTILQTVLDIDKLKSSRYGESELRQYINGWTPADIYTMFEQTYEELKRSRSSSTDIKSSIIYLLSLLTVSPIPNRRGLS